MDILLVDNDDSFTRNLEHLLAGVCGRAPRIAPVRSTWDAVGCDLAVISPGPGHPLDYPYYNELLDGDIPVLGICLGMQIINQHHGGDTGRLPGCVHGRAEAIRWDGRDYDVARYHSLAITRVGAGIEILAENTSGTPMVISHRRRRQAGFQFHPESFLTPDGEELLLRGLDLLDIG